MLVSHLLTGKKTTSNPVQTYVKVGGEGDGANRELGRIQISRSRKKINEKGIRKIAGRTQNPVKETEAGLTSWEDHSLLHQKVR